MSMMIDDGDEEGDLNASKRYSASTETVRGNATQSTATTPVGHGMIPGYASVQRRAATASPQKKTTQNKSMSASMTSLRSSPYSRRRSSMESLTPRFSASIRSIPETVRFGDDDDGGSRREVGRVPAARRLSSAVDSSSTSTSTSTLRGDVEDDGDDFHGHVQQHFSENVFPLGESNVSNHEFDNFYSLFSRYELILSSKTVFNTYRID
jgi:hypothetical protein